MLNPDRDTINFGGREIVLADLSRGTKISISHLSKIMSGDRFPSAHFLNRIAAYLGVSMDELYHEFLTRTNAQTTDSTFS